MSSLQVNGGAAAMAGSLQGGAESDDGRDEQEDTMDLSHISPSRFPPATQRVRRLSKEEPYVHSVSQTQYGHSRLRGRRQSDPGRISLSPIRMPPRSVENEISEDDEDSESGRGACHPRLFALRSISMTVPEEYPEDTIRSLSPQHRSRPRERAKRRTLRSNSLPTSDPAIFEIGEAIGAVAISRPPPIVEPTPADYVKLSPTGVLNRRRRSVSIESTNLEAIHEDNDLGELGSALTIQKASRRLSTPALHIHDTKT